MGSKKHASQIMDCDICLQVLIISLWTRGYSAFIPLFPLFTKWAPIQVARAHS